MAGHDARSVDTMDVDAMNARLRGRLPALLGIEVVAAAPGRLTCRLPIRPELLAPNGFLHGGTVVALADTAAGVAAHANLPAGASGHTTVELKTNFLGTARDGAIRCDAVLVHGGRSTQVWDATVVDEASGSAIAVFRCTQLVLYDRGAGRQPPGR